jgi:hypothetical protein
VLYNTATIEARCVMDTKYKAACAPSSDDLAQVVAYAEAKGCNEALLVYPSALFKPLGAGVGGIRVLQPRLLSEWRPRPGRSSVCAGRASARKSVIDNRRQAEMDEVRMSKSDKEALEALIGDSA